MEHFASVTQIETVPIMPASTDSFSATAGLASNSTANFSFTQKPLVDVSDSELRARVHWANISTPRFFVHYDRVCYHEREAGTIAHTLEDICRTIFSMTHEGFYGQLQVYLCDLRSPALLGRKTKTHFNLAEHSVYLVRSSFEAAEAELVAMISHAMRFGRYLKHYGITPGWAMLEDAFATFVTERVMPGRSSYPFYGADPDVIAQHLKGRGLLPSLSYAWHSVRFSSEIERRVLAGAFLLYLGDTASDDSVIHFSRWDDDITSNTFEVCFGASLDQLEEDWTAHLPKTLCLYTDAERQEMILRWNAVMRRRHS
ncbi:MAG TPA: hypothetical protein VFO76_06315 [Candidatus Kapabacteria bacterium]|nr:hypothetical protein [Candidatus Kapabacteria bacterium]